MPRGRPKGLPKTGGRRKGSVNHTTKDLKEAILQAFTQVGGKGYLVTVAERSPQVFCTLLGKVLPTQLTGEDGAAIRVKFVEALIDSPHSRKAGPALPDPVPVHSLNGVVPGIRGGSGSGEN